MKKAVILAAGLGSRLLPATKAVSKPLLPIVDKPGIQYLVEELAEAGIKDICIVVNKGETRVQQHFAKNPRLNKLLERAGKHDCVKDFERIESLARLVFVEQPKPAGPGDAVLLAKNFIGNEAFVLLYSDDVVLSKGSATRQLIAAFEKCNAGVVAVSKVPREEVVHFGVVKTSSPEKLSRVEKIVEKPKLSEAPSDLAVVGRYLLTPEVIGILEKMPLAGKELFVTDALEVLASSKRLFALELDGKWLTTGKKLDYVKTVVEFALLREDIGQEFRAYLKKLLE